MLATASVQHEVPLREHSHIDLQDRAASASNAGLEEQVCPGCKKSAVSESGGLVVAFGQSFFHVDCFKCAKCGDQVTADTNLLLLSDGSPICANCSYSCNVCNQPILDEAIMTGDDSYHAHCFKCKVCKNRIEDLVFAKTKQGIYCMNCHNERMIKVRKHAQKKAEKERAAASTSSRTREAQAKEYHRDPAQERYQADEFGNRANQANPPYGDEFANSTSARTNRKPPPLIKSSSSSSQIRGIPTPPQYASHPTTPPANVTSTISARPPNFRSASDRQNSFPHPNASPVVSPPPGDNAPSPQNLQPPVNIPESLTPGNTTSRAAKRGSINPGLMLSKDFLNQIDSAGSRLSPTLSPRSISSPSPPVSGGRDSPRAPSPRRENFPSSSGTRPSFEATSRPSSARKATDASGWPSHLTDHTRMRTVSADTYSHEREQAAAAGQPNGATPHRTTPSSSAANMRSQSSLDLQNSGSRRPTSASSANGINGTRRSRPTTPMHKDERRADVPSGIDSGTDNETESAHNAAADGRPPALPPKDPRQQRPTLTTRPSSSKLESESSGGGGSGVTSPADTSDLEDLTESPVEQVSHTTFIAPALPPIRISLNPDDFSSLLQSVNGLPPLKALEMLAENAEDNVTPTTPPPTANYANGSNADGARTPTASHKGPSVLSAPALETSSSGSTPSITLDSAPSRSDTLYSESTTSLQSLTASDSLQSETDTLTSSTRRSPPYSQQLYHRKQNSSSSERSIMGNGDLASSSSRLNLSLNVTIAEPGSDVPKVLPKPDTYELVLRRLREAVSDSAVGDHKGSGLLGIQLDRPFVETVIRQLEMRTAQWNELRGSVDGFKRASQHYKEGLTVAQAEYDVEARARRDAEAEVKRLRVILSEQAARLTTLSGDNKRQELKQQLSKSLHDDLAGLEQDLSKLRVERDMALAEVEELSATKGSTTTEPAGEQKLGRSLTVRLDKIKTQYNQELVPLKQQREALTREVMELKSVRDTFLEETTALSERAEALAQLTQVYSRRVESLPDSVKQPRPLQEKPSTSFERARQQQNHGGPFNPAMNGSTSNFNDGLLNSGRKDTVDATPSKAQKVFGKWVGGARQKGDTNPVAISQPQPHAGAPGMEREKSGGSTNGHMFQQHSVLRFTRCDHCGEKLWGSQLRCSVCNISIHVRCCHNVSINCQQPTTIREEPSVLPPSMFGRDLVEQVQADANGDGRMIPVIVDKCIEAVEELALDYEGIYRKTGGSGQSRMITGLFERGDYDSINLLDQDRFNDICSVTSVLKNYFRSLPVPLLTFDLHEKFMAAVELKDPAQKSSAMKELVDELPPVHYHTLKKLMIHLNHVCKLSDVNLMNGRNLGLVFGPTLMRSRDPAAEYGDMAGKSLSIEWLIDNAATVFP